MLDNITPLPSTVIERSLSAPMVIPESLTIPSVPVVVSLASDLRNDAAAMPPRASASVAVPCNLIPEGDVVNVIPLYTVGKPVMGIKHYWGRYEFAHGRGQIHAHILCILDDEIKKDLREKIAKNESIGLPIAEVYANWAKQHFGLTASLDPNM